MIKIRFISLILFLFLPFVVSAQKLNEDLLEATRKSDAAKVKTLLEQGADVNAKSPYGATPLFFACDRSNVEIVKLLLERGADVNAKDTFYGATPLGWSLNKGNPEIIKMLIEKGSKEKAAGLDFAIKGGHVAVAKAALDQGGFEQNALNKALRAAQSKGNKDIIELLKTAGAKEIPEFKVAPEALKMYEGAFKGDAFSIIFTIKDGKLIGNANGSDSVLIPVSQHNFDVEGATGVTVVFALESEKITGLTLQTPNAKFVMKKEIK